MIHFQPDSNSQPAPYLEAVERLRSVRKALALVDMLDGRPRRTAEEIEFEPLFLGAPPAVQRCAEGRSIRAAGAAEAGLDALLGAESHGERTHEAAFDVLSQSLRQDLESIAALFAGRA
jgi:hypothetical protein